MMGSVQVSAPARLHFGLTRLSQREGPSYGGLGLMLQRPRAVVEVRAALRWRPGVGSDARCTSVCRRALDAWDKQGELLAVDARVVECMPLHRGLGAGTQLALAAAAGVRELLDLPPAPADELAFVAGRGARSAVGAHGFIHGGLIWEDGRLPGDRLGRLERRVALPAAWRVLLAIPRSEEGLSGPAESAAFDRLPNPPATTTERLIDLAVNRILPAARRGAFDDFSNAVFEYSRESGGLFAPVQGGEYASAAIAARVALLRAAGVAGVGQSSWGPAVFALMRDQREAAIVANKLRRDRIFADCDLIVARVENHPAQVVAGVRLADVASS